MPDPQRETRRTYDAIAPLYAERTRDPFPILIERGHSFAAEIGAGGFVMDAGCGPGRDVALLRSLGLRSFGVDLSSGQLHAAAPECAGTLMQADMAALPVRDHTVDGVWCQAALLHIPRASVPVVLAEFARTVRHGGKLELAVLEGEGEGWSPARRYDSARTRYFVYHSAASLSQALDTAGFAVRSVDRAQRDRTWLYVRADRR